MHRFFTAQLLLLLPLFCAAGAPYGSEPHIYSPKLSDGAILFEPADPLQAALSNIETNPANCEQRWKEFKGGFSYTACSIKDIIADRAALDPDDPQYRQKRGLLKRMLNSYRGGVALPVTPTLPPTTPAPVSKSVEPTGR